ALLGLAEAVVGTFEELLLCRLEELSADFGKLGGKRLLRLDHFLQTFVEPLFAFALRGLQRGELTDRRVIRIALLDDFIELEAKVLDGLLRPGRVAACPKPADDSADQQAQEDERSRFHSIPRWNRMGTV